MGEASKIRQPGALVARDFEDVDELAEGAGFDTHFRQLTYGAQHIRARLRLGRQLTVVRMWFNCGFHQRGMPPGEMLTFGVPFTGMQDWCARPHAPGDWLNFNSDAGVDGVSRPGFTALTVSLSYELLESSAANVGLAVPTELLYPNSGAVIKASGRTRVLAESIQRLLADASLPLDPDCETAIAVDVLEAAAGSDDEIIAAPAVRSRAITKALTYLEAHADEPVHVGELCAKTGIAWRTLNRAFRERFGIGPKAYMNRERLLRVRSVLLRSSQTTAIADVANAAGFWHMGQFARDYCRLFGELPSATLRR